MLYTIGEAAKKLGLTAPALRFYNKEGLLPFVYRSASGIRMFKDEDFEWLRLIKCLKATGMPINYKCWVLRHRSCGGYRRYS